MPGAGLDSFSLTADSLGMTRLSASSFAVLAAVLVIVFGAALAVGGPGSNADRALIAAAGWPELTPAARFFTRLADWWVALLIAAVCAAVLAHRGHARRGLLLLGLLISGRLLVELMKLAFDRGRPDPAGHEVAVHSMAFPSGHSANAMMLGLGLALLLPLGRRARVAALAAALGFALAIGASRVVLGVHWPSDVMGGWSFGALWTLLLLRLFGGTSPDRPH